MSGRLCVLLVSVIAVCGCGDSLPDRVPVSGKVTYNGAAVEGAAVVFVPVEGGPAATATTDAVGQFKLSTFEAHDGAVPGSYTISIAKTKQTGGKVMTADEEHEAVLAGKEIQPPTFEDLVPTRYKSSSTSGLAEDVTEDGENIFTFELTDG